MNAIPPFVDSTAFLQPLQAGLDAGVLVEERVAVVRGRAKGARGAPLKGVTVAALGRPELGVAKTHDDGQFDFLVNGGGEVVLDFQLEGYLPAQRRVVVPWNDYASTDDVTLLQVDPSATVVTFGARALEAQVASGSVMVDDAGVRRATVFFPSGTTAAMVMPSGERRPMSQGTFRATEYTVGDEGPSAMPGALPPSVAYTYAVEVGFDEARAAGAVSVEFDRQVALYVDEYLGFRVGTMVPVASYDRLAGVWQPSDNGRVVKVLDVVGGVASIDFDGDGVAESDAALARAGISPEELRAVGSTWATGKVLTRTPATHFTPTDCNFPWALPPGAEPPEEDPPQQSDDVICENSQSGSIISCESQTLGEVLPLTGVPFSLVYSSKDVPGRLRGLNIPIMMGHGNSSSVASSAVVELSVAGRQYSYAGLAPTPQMMPFSWDGMDAYGRPTTGAVTVRGRTGYVFPLVYATGAEFIRLWGQAGSASYTLSRPGKTVTLWQEWTAEMRAASATSPALPGAENLKVDLGGWRPSLIQKYSGFEKTVAPNIDTLVGTGKAYTGDNGPAAGATLNPAGLAMGLDGTLYVSDVASMTVRAVSPAGAISQVAGGGVSQAEGLVTLGARLSPGRLAVGPGGRLYLVDGSRIRRVRADGTIETVTGMLRAGYAGDGRPASEAMLNAPQGLAFASDGSLYIADTGNHRLRKVDAMGVMSTVAGTGTCGYSGDGATAAAAQLCSPTDVAVGSDGAVYVADSGNHRIRRIDAAGVVTTVAGTGVSGFSGDSGQAVNAQLSTPTGLSFDASGALLVADGVRIRRVELTSGVITTTAGGGTGGDGGPATAAILNPVAAVVRGAKGVYFTDSQGLKVRRVRPDGLLETMAGGQPLLNGEGGKARNASVTAPSGVAVGADGAVYVSTGPTVMKATRQGQWLRVAGVPGQTGYSGDMGQATAALLSGPTGLAVGRDGTLYIADTGNNRIRRVSVEGTITTLAGTGTPGFGGDGSLATEALLNGPKGVAVDGEGVVFIADTRNHRIRRVSLDGTVTTYAGTGTPGQTGNGGPAVAAMLHSPSGVALTAGGVMYVADTGNQAIRRIDATGVISTAAGGAAKCASNAGDGVTSVGSCFTFPTGVATSPSGGVYVADSGNNRIQFLGGDGVLTVVAGGGGAFFSGDKGPATRASLRGPLGVAVSPSGQVVIADTGNSRVRAINSGVGATSGDETMVASGDGSEVYVFNRTKQHVRTVSGLTGVLRWAFEYDERGMLLSVTDGEGRKTVVERDSASGLITVTGPYGHRNVLTLDGTGYLKTVTNPLGETVTLTHSELGLLRKMVDARGGEHAFTYDLTGRLVRDTNALGGFKELTRTPLEGTKYQVTVTTAGGLKTTYETTPDTGAGEGKRVTAPDGTVSTSVHFRDGSSTATAANGTKTSLVTGGDARYGTMSPTAASQTVKMPSGLTWQGGETSAVSWVNGSEAYGLESLTRTKTVNGSQWQTTYLAADRTWTWKTPMGRSGKVVLDEKERPVRSETPGVEAATFEYDATGRLESVTQGARKVSWKYDGQGNVESMTDAKERVVGYGYNGAQRPTEVRLPGVGTLSLKTDANGNVTKVTTPGGKQYGHSYGLASEETSYSPPELPGVLPYTYQYSPDMLLTSWTHPDGSQSVPRRDGTGRVTAVEAPWGVTGYWYTSGTGQLWYATRNGQKTEYWYDGALLTKEVSSGVVSGAVSWTFDSFFRVASLAVNGETAVYGYDADGMLASAGPVVLTRNPTTGQVVTADVGRTRTTYGYDAYGALELMETSVAGASVYREVVGWDGGVVAGKTEVVQGEASHWDYGYDEALRLTEAKKDGIVSGTWTYDADGNRTTVNGATAKYDGQDRLTSVGGVTYAYDAWGNRRWKMEGPSSTEYRYQGPGELAQVVLPDGTSIEYVIDYRGRRVGKRKNGVFQTGWVYDGQLRIVGEVDAKGATTSRFVYGTLGHSPDVMVRGGVTYRYVHDAQGSVRLVVNASTGAVAQRMDYDAWGVLGKDTSPGFQPFGYAGGLYDADTGLVRFGARDYDATTGVWLEWEPLSQSPSFTANMARSGRGVVAYAYALNAPVFFVDPTGFDVAIPWWGPSPAVVPLLPEVATGAAIVGGAAAGGAAVAATIYVGVGQWEEPGAGVPFPVAPPLPVSHPASEPGVPAFPVEEPTGRKMIPTTQAEPDPRPTPPVKQDCNLLLSACVARCSGACTNAFTRATCKSACIALYVVCVTKPGSH